MKACCQETFFLLLRTFGTVVLTSSITKRNEKYTLIYYCYCLYYLFITVMPLFQLSNLLYFISFDVNLSYFIFVNFISFIFSFLLFISSLLLLIHFTWCPFLFHLSSVSYLDSSTCTHCTKEQPPNHWHTNKHHVLPFLHYITSWHIDHPHATS